MRKIIFNFLAIAFGVAFIFGDVTVNIAQENTVEFTLEEITVTAEKREADIQKVAASVDVIVADDMLAAGKLSAGRILENVPNLTGDTIRGVVGAGNTGGDAASQDATATYVDGVFSGMGGNYDLERVEVLRGPQGTLYGRAATGGVISYHTSDPRLGEFSGSFFAEYGNPNLRHSQVVVNVPVNDMIALRLSGRYQYKEGYVSGEGGASRTMEGRIKGLYQPSDQFNIVLAYEKSTSQSASGGVSAMLTAPNTINYHGRETEITPISKAIKVPYQQGSVNINYDFGSSALTYTGAVKDHKQGGERGQANFGDSIQSGGEWIRLDRTFTQELRLTSDTEKRLKWLIGANFYKKRDNKYSTSVQVMAFLPDGVTEDEPATRNAKQQTMEFDATTINWGLFTEETYDIRDDLRVTAGLRYDSNNITQSSISNFNTNINSNGMVRTPETWATYSLLDYKQEFKNFTYKLRFEYDLTPQNMFYASTSTGFLPGNVSISASPQMDMATRTVTGMDFKIFSFDEQELTAYEVGSKNRFFGNTLQVNGSIFFYDYEGYQAATNIKQGPGAPNFVVLGVPLQMKGAELDAEWIATDHDIVSYNFGYLDAKITDFPIILDVDTADFMTQARWPGLPKMTSSLTYRHNFILSNGSTLVPRAEIRYRSGGYLAQLNRTQVALGELPYAYQKAYMIGDVSATWTSPMGMYMVSSYVRNIMDKEYKAGVSLSSSSLNNIGVTPGDPRTFGAVLNIKF